MSYVNKSGERSMADWRLDKLHKPPNTTIDLPSVNSDRPPYPDDLDTSTVSDPGRTSHLSCPELPRPVVAERVARRLDVLGQEVRVRLIYALRERDELSVGELAELIGVSVYDVSQHLSVLRGEGIVHGSRDGQFVRYRLDDPTAVAFYEQVTNRIREQIEHARREFSTDQTDLA